MCILTVEIIFPVNRDYAIRRNTLRREDGVSSKRNALPTSVRTSRPLRRERVGCGTRQNIRAYGMASMADRKDDQGQIIFG